MSIGETDYKSRHVITCLVNYVADKVANNGDSGAAKAKEILKTLLLDKTFVNSIKGPEDDAIKSARLTTRLLDSKTLALQRKAISSSTVAEGFWSELLKPGFVSEALGIEIKACSNGGLQDWLTISLCNVVGVDHESQQDSRAIMNALSKYLLKLYHDSSSLLSSGKVKAKAIVDALKDLKQGHIGLSDQQIVGLLNLHLSSEEFNFGAAVKMSRGFFGSPAKTFLAEVEALRAPAVGL